MIENLNELIEHNLQKFGKTKGNVVWKFQLTDLNGDELDDSERLAQIMQRKGLIDIEDDRCDLTEMGFRIVKNGGWLEYLKNKNEEERIIQSEIKRKENLEIELAESNLEANRLNKKIAKKNQKNEKSNRIATWVNIGIGFINIGLLIWQILKK